MPRRTSVSAGLATGPAQAVRAAILFVFSGRTIWRLALIMMIGAVLGGAIGGRMASRLRPETLRWTVVVLGTAAGLWYLIH